MAHAHHSPATPHEDGDSHSRSHKHGHSHGSPPSYSRAFALGVGLNIAFVAVEVIFGVLAHSVALLSDAGHNFSDVLALVVAWVASELVKRAPTPRYTYGLRGSSILAALFNAMLLLFVVGALSLEAIRRFGDLEPVAGGTVMAVAALGIVINGATAMLFASGRDIDINLRGAFLHMAADAAISAAVVGAGLAILLTGWQWLDPLVSLAVNAAVVLETWGLLKDSLSMSMAAAPRRIDPAAVRACVAGRTGVASVHDLHIWPMSTTEIALTCHLVMPGGHPGDAFLHELCAELDHRFAIRHPTVQIETDPDFVCALAPIDVV